MATKPSLEGSYDSVTEFISWITAEQIEGNIDRHEAKELRDHARAMLSVLRARHSEQELEKAEALVRRAEKAAQAAAGREVQQRYNQKS